MKRTLVVPPQNTGERLDIYLKKNLPDESRAFLQRQIFDGKILLNGRRARPRTKLVAGDTLTAEIQRPPSELAPSLSPVIPVIFENAELLVINKPSGITVHPAHFPGNNTVANWLISQYPEIRSVGDSRIRPGIVHRLDKGTSGVMVIAKTQKMFEYLKRLFKERVVKKEYTAILEGKISKTKGVVEGYLAPSKKNYRKKKFQVLPSSGKAKMSRTKFEAIRYADGLTLAKFFPETGRTHQIRVHAKSLGAPVLGDALYGAETKLPEDFRGRFFLHASKISFPFPDDSEKSFSAPLPEDFKKVIEWLGATLKVGHRRNAVHALS
ncbi:MAG: RluA family pseudouridine synthase [bacterium]|nr:RluA family pseudouridine synthase [bacterium]